MKKKIIYSVLIVLFVAAIIFTAVKGFKVDLYYAEGEVVTVNAGRDINLKEISGIVKEVFKGQNVLVQEVELFKDSFSVKTTNVNEEQLNNCDFLLYHIDHLTKWMLCVLSVTKINK